MGDTASERMDGSVWGIESVNWKLKITRNSFYCMKEKEGEGEDVGRNHCCIEPFRCNPFFLCISSTSFVRSLAKSSSTMSINNFLRQRMSYFPMMENHQIWRWQNVKAKTNWEKRNGKHATRQTNWAERRHVVAATTVLYVCVCVCGGRNSGVRAATAATPSMDDDAK